MHAIRQAVLTIILLFIIQTALAGEGGIVATGKRINIIVSCKSQKIDIATWSFHLQTHLNRILHGKKFHFLIVSSLDEARERICRIAEKEKAMIGQIWFDSHGHYGRRTSLVEVGNTEINAQTIQFPYIEEALNSIARYCDKNTIISLGACYSAATFIVPAVDKFPEQRMNGDTLMMRMSSVMNGAIVLGTRSWVMTKPGIFNKEFALSGNPIRKRFRDTDLLPAWKDLGEWVSYSSTDSTFKKIRSVYLNNEGMIQSTYQDYLSIDRHQKQQMKNISRLKNGNFRIKFFYEYEFPKQGREDQTAKRTTRKPVEERTSGE